MMRLIPACFAFILLASALLGQGTFRFQTTVELPRSAREEVDHATLAINDRGDIFLAWQIHRSDLSSPNYGVRQVEGVLLERVGTSGWTLPKKSDVIVLGNPALGLTGGVDTCRKPDVVAVGNNFVVTWPRNIPAGAPGAGMGMLEAALVIVNPGSPPVVDGPQPGAGYPIDPNVESGVGGIMPDLVRLRRSDNLAGVFYIHEESDNGAGWREYDLRFVLVDFNTSPPTWVGPSVAVDNLPLDDSDITGAPVGGFVLPDAVEDDYGSIVVAHESYVQAGHLGAPKDKGSIVIRRFQETSGVLGELDSWEYVGSSRANRQRRPNLSTSRHDKNNSVSATWMEKADTVGAVVDAQHYELTFVKSGMPGPVTERDLQYPNTGHDSILPVPLHADGLRMGLATKRLSQQTPTVAWIPNVYTNLVQVPSPVVDPSRPAGEIAEFGNIGMPGSRIVPISYEGSGSGGVRSIYLVVYRL